VCIYTVFIHYFRLGCYLIDPNILADMFEDDVLEMLSQKLHCSAPVGHVEVPAPIVAPSASQVDPVANAPVAIPYVPDPTNVSI
jgi:hypothetical protein